MKGQFVFVGETEKDGNYKIAFTFSTDKMQRCITAIGKVSENKIELPLSKGSPAIGTAKRTNPSQGGTTGPTSILLTAA